MIVCILRQKQTPTLQEVHRRAVQKLLSDDHERGAMESSKASGTAPRPCERQGPYGLHSVSLLGTDRAFPAR